MLSIKGNILHLIDTLGLGGAQRVVQGLFEHNTENSKLHLLALRQTHDQITIDHPQVDICTSTGKWNFQKPLKMALQIIQEKNIRTLHCHLPKSQLTGFLIKRFYFPSIRLIFHEQGDIMDPIPANFPGYWVAKNKIDGILCCSNAVRSQLLQKTGYPRQKSSVLYNFVDTNYFTPSHTTRHKGNGLHIGFAGRITKRKGWREFLQALAHLRKHLDVVGHIAGTGPEKEALHREIRRLNLGNMVHLHGFVEDRVAFYNQLDLLCVPSHWEPVGMVHLEAMSCGVPVVASDVAGLNEILQHEKNCLLFPPKNPRALSRSIEQLLRDPELRAKLTENGKETAHQYDYFYHERHLNDFYQQLRV